MTVSINKQTKLWALSHVSSMALIASLGACTTAPMPEPTQLYNLCEPVAPATTCGDNVNVKVK